MQFTFCFPTTHGKNFPPAAGHCCYVSLTFMKIFPSAAGHCCRISLTYRKIFPPENIDYQRNSASNRPMRCYALTERAVKCDQDLTKWTSTKRKKYFGARHQSHIFMSDSSFTELSYTTRAGRVTKRPVRLADSLIVN